MNPKTTEWQFNTQQLEPPSLACNINVFFFLTYLATTPVDGTPLMDTLDYTIYQGSIYLTYLPYHLVPKWREREEKTYGTRWFQTWSIYMEATTLPIVPRG